MDCGHIDITQFVCSVSAIHLGCLFFQICGYLSPLRFFFKILFLCNVMVIIVYLYIMGSRQRFCTDSNLKFVEVREDKNP